MTARSSWHDPLPARAARGRLRWLTILSGRVRASLAVTGGVRTAVDAVKAVMTGAHAVQVVSALLKQGPDYLRTLIADFGAWMEEHEYEYLQQMQGNMNMQACPDPKVYERANYMLVLQGWKGEQRQRWPLHAALHPQT